MTTTSKTSKTKPTTPTLPTEPDSCMTWEPVGEDVSRFQIPGGHLYKIRNGYHFSVVFVPRKHDATCPRCQGKWTP
jgi:hypothetical protein